VDGIFGQCPRCGLENLLVYDINLAILRREIKKNSNRDRALRHVYNDLVSTFESFCRRKAPESAQCNFQDPLGVRRFFKKKRGVDIFEGHSAQDMLVVRRLFAKRHVYEHNGGVIHERYVKKVPEDATRFGERADLSIEEFERAAELVRRALDRIAG
jgi:hypothetical protein